MMLCSACALFWPAGVRLMGVRDLGLVERGLDAWPVRVLARDGPVRAGGGGGA